MIWPDNLIRRDAPEPLSRNSTQRRKSAAQRSRNQNGARTFQSAATLDWSEVLKFSIAAEMPCCCGQECPRAETSAPRAKILTDSTDARLLLPLPTTREWGEDRGEGQSQPNAPPLPGPLVHPMEERELLWLRLGRAASLRLCASALKIVCIVPAKRLVNISSVAKNCGLSRGMNWPRVLAAPSQPKAHRSKSSSSSFSSSSSTFGRFGFEDEDDDEEENLSGLRKLLRMAVKERGGKIPASSAGCCGWDSRAQGEMLPFSFPHKLRHRFRARLHVELFVNAADVISHRVNADAELIRNLFVSQTFRQPVQHR